MTEQRDSAVTAAELDAMRVYAHEATMAITGLVGGGSECFGRELNGIFTADLPYCVGRIRDRIDASAERELNARRDLVALRRERDDLQRMYAAMCAQGREQIAKKDAALREIAESGAETFCINPEGAPNIMVEGGMRFAHERDVDRLLKIARAALAPAAQGEDEPDEEICPYCGRDPYHYEDIGTDFPARVAVNCCDRMCEEIAKNRAAPAPSAGETRAAIIEECAKTLEDAWSLAPESDGVKTLRFLQAAIRALASVKQELT